MISESAAVSIFKALPEALQAYLLQRGGPYDISASELLRKIPETLLDNPIEIYNFLKLKDISHLQATSNGGIPNSFFNWVFEDASINRSRQAATMTFNDLLSAHLDNQVDSGFVEFGTSDPGSPAYNAAFKELFGDLESFPIASDYSTAATNFNSLHGNYYDADHGTYFNLGDHTERLLKNSIEQLGIPIGYITIRGIRQIWPFLQSIDWREFRASSNYRFHTLNRALLTFRRGGWKEIPKAVVMGILISAFPPLSYLVAALGITGVASLGVRWLASLNDSSSPISNILSIAHSSIVKVQTYLVNVLKSIEKIVDVVIEKAGNAVKDVVSVASGFVRSVSDVAHRVAASCVAAAKTVVSMASNSIKAWILNWFVLRPA